jgi:hypothetical protein
MIKSKTIMKTPTHKVVKYYCDKCNSEVGSYTKDYSVFNIKYSPDNGICPHCGKSLNS